MDWNKRAKKLAGSDKKNYRYWYSYVATGCGRQFMQIQIRLLLSFVFDPRSILKLRMMNEGIRGGGRRGG